MESVNHNLEDLVDLWPRYEEIRKLGYYNMFTEGKYVADIMGIDLDTYMQILENYSTLKDMYEKGR